MLTNKIKQTQVLGMHNHTQFGAVAEPQIPLYNILHLVMST